MKDDNNNIDNKDNTTDNRLNTNNDNNNDKNCNHNNTTVSTTATTHTQTDTIAPTTRQNPSQPIMIHVTLDNLSTLSRHTTLDTITNAPITSTINTPISITVTIGTTTTLTTNPEVADAQQIRTNTEEFLHGNTPTQTTTTTTAVTTAYTPPLLSQRKRKQKRQQELDYLHDKAAKLFDERFTDPAFESNRETFFNNYFLYLEKRNRDSASGLRPWKNNVTRQNAEQEQQRTPQPTTEQTNNTIQIDTETEAIIWSNIQSIQLKSCIKKMQDTILEYSHTITEHTNVLPHITIPQIISEAAGNAVTDITQIIETLDNNSCNQPFFRCRVAKQVFQDILASLRHHTEMSIIQVIRSTSIGLMGSVDFYLGSKTLLSVNRQHIYWDHHRFWDESRNEWDSEGRYLGAPIQADKHTTHATRTVSFDPMVFPNTIIVAFELLSNPDAPQKLQQLIDLFETDSSTSKRILIGILGSGHKGETTLTKFLKHFPDPEVLHNRIIYYKNSTQFRDVTDKFNVTHIVDYRPGYIRKALIRPEYLSRAYLLQPNKPQKHQNHDLITHVSDWDALITSLQQKNTTDTEQPTRRRLRTVKPVEHTRVTKLDTHSGGTKKFVCWNQNSLRSVHKSGHLISFILTNDADLIGITELRGTPEDVLLIADVYSALRLAGYEYQYYNPATPNKGLYGTAIFSRIRPKEILKNIGCLDTDGRVITAIFEHFVFILAYVPTLGFNHVTGEVTNMERRKTFDEHLSAHLDRLSANCDVPIILAGDLNTCIHPQHIWDQSLLTSPFPSCTPDERKRMHQIMTENELVTAFDALHPKTGKNFTYFFEDNPNKGMLIDHFLVPSKWVNHTDKDRPLVTNASILSDQLGSDHVPVSIHVKFPESYTFQRYRNKYDKRRQTQKQLQSFTAEAVTLNTMWNKPTYSTSIGMTHNNELSRFLHPQNTPTDVNGLLTNLMKILESTPPNSLTTTESTTQTNSIARTEESCDADTETSRHTKQWVPHIYTCFGTPNVQTHAMVDTGANGNIMTKQFLDKHVPNAQLTPTTARLIVGDATESPILGGAWVPFTIDSQRFLEYFYIINQANSEIILGSCFLHKHHAKICYRRQTMRYYPNTMGPKQITTIFDTENPPQTSFGYSLRLTEDTVIPANMHQEVWSSLSNKLGEFWHGQFGEILVSPELPYRYGCQTSLGFTYILEKGRTKVLLMNITGEPVTLPKGTEVARYSPKTETEFCEGGVGTSVTTEELTPTFRTTIQGIIDTATANLNRKQNLTSNNVNITPTGDDNKVTNRPEQPTPADQIPDYSQEELEQFFSQPGLKELLPNLNREQMHVPGPPTEQQIYKLKQLIAKRRNIFTDDETKPRHVKGYTVTIPHDNKPVVDTSDFSTVVNS